MLNTVGISDKFYTRAWQTYAATSSRLRAIVDACTQCEQLQCDGSVGYGGSPDEQGRSTLDALLIDGPQHLTGAVAQLKQTRTASQVAWAVINYTKHSLLVGDLADQFAQEMGFQSADLETTQSTQLWETWQNNSCQPNFRQNVSPDPAKSCGPYTPLEIEGASNLPFYQIQQQTGPHFQHDTIGIVIVDPNGDISAGTSTNGASHKIPGRVSDSALVGAGAYVDNEHAGCAATGDGDVMQKFVPCFRTVEEMRLGKNANNAAASALRQIAKYYDTFQGAIVAVDKRGNFGAACHGIGTFTYSVASPASNGAVQLFTVSCIDNAAATPNSAFNLLIFLHLSLAFVISIFVLA